MLALMNTRRVVIYMPDGLLEALNRATAGSPQSRSELICEAVERHLKGDLPATSAEDREAFDARVAELIQHGLLQPGDFPLRDDPEQPNPKSKLWIN
jgi:hypothetical protein